MITTSELAPLRQHGYVHVPGVLTAEWLERLRPAFDAASKAGNRQRVWQETLLGIPEFLELLEYPPLLDRLRAVFGDQLQMLSYDLLYQAPQTKGVEYNWHRDFVFPGDEPLAVNSIIYLDDIDAERGPTSVIPGTHRGHAVPPKDKVHGPLPGQVRCCVKAGDVVFINSAVWHSGGLNRSATGERRVIYLYWGYWWLKRDYQHAQIPSAALAGASDTRRNLLGLLPPGKGDMWMYDPPR